MFPLWWLDVCDLSLLRDYGNIPTICGTETDTGFKVSCRAADETRRENDGGSPPYNVEERSAGLGPLLYM